MKKIIAVDFDGTLVECAYPNIGKIKQKVVNKVREWYNQGHTIIIWTCRCGESLQEAVKFLDENDIPYNALNLSCNSPYNGDPRKIYSDVYLDDRALNVDDLDYFNLDTLTHINYSEVMQDMKTLICNIHELSIHKVDPDLSEVRNIIKKYNLDKEVKPHE